MQEIQPLLEIIALYLPDLEVHNAQQPSPGGQYNRVLFVNQDLIFRFPRFAEGFETMRKEVRILQALGGRLSLPVPDPIYLHLDRNEPTHSFMGYVRLPGTPLWRETLNTIREAPRLEAFAQQLAGFLSDLHDFPIEQLEFDLNTEDIRQEALKLFAEIRTELFARMRADSREAVRKHFEAFIDSPELHVFTPQLIHGDFGGSNILHDPEAGRITGVIDFGFSGAGDPAQDLAAVSTYGQGFFERFLKHYPHDPNMQRRAAFYRGTFALEEALYGLRHGDLEAYRAGMATYV